MAYDRYDNRRDRDWRGSNDSYRSSPSSDMRGARRDERGFWERAGDEVASWFGDDEAERRRDHDERMDRDRGGSWSGMTSGGWSPERNDDRGYGREFDRDRDRYAYRSGRSSFGSGSDRDRSYRPMAGDYGRSSAPGSRDDYRETTYAGLRSTADRDSDRHYHSWRKRQMDELDRDYDRYNRERQERFENDFGSWRQTRMSKRSHLGSIREHMEVVGSDGETIGKVDKVHGDHIILTKSDSPDNRHHAIDCSMIQSIEGDQVRLDMPAEEAKSRWEDSDGRGIFGREWDRDRDRDEDVNLNRAFAGTYDDR
jgi:hypothetical protein